MRIMAMKYIVFVLLRFFSDNKCANANYNPPSDDFTYYCTLTVTAAYFELQLQDDQDANEIMNSGYSDNVVASIIPFRDKVRRVTINKRISALSGTPYIAGDYIIRSIGRDPIYKDLIFGLVCDELRVIYSYLRYGVITKDETLITMCLVLSKDIFKTRQHFDEEYSFQRSDALLDDQRKPYRNMLNVWIFQNREAIEQGELGTQDVINDANALKKENEKGGWHEDRGVIEKILMKKSVKYARAVIAEFEKTPCNKALEDIIQDNVKNHDLNHDLADAYAFLTRYIKNKYKFIADKLADFSDGSDQWSVWIMCIAALDAKEWPKVNDEFKKNQNGKSLSQFIVEKLPGNKLFAETIVVVVDPSFKPTQFVEKPVNKELEKLCDPPVTFPAGNAPAPPAPSNPPPHGVKSAHG